MIKILKKGFYMAKFAISGFACYISGWRVGVRVGWTLDHPACACVRVHYTIYSIIYVLIDTLVELNKKSKEKENII